MAKFASTLILLSFIAFNSFANFPTATSSGKPSTVVELSNVVNQTGLQMMANFKGKNEIKLLNNRFRIDAEVDEIMLLFFRRHGSSPVVLVKPDGSKIYPRDADKQMIFWHDDVAYDLIRLKEPTPGPWQALGRILPESKIMVLSDVELQVEPLPDPIFQYEIIKSTAKIVNAGHIINEPGFHEVIELDARMYSTNDSSESNFGAAIYKLGKFLDNGKDLDERRRDGVFTVKYDIAAIPGLWDPKFKVTAALFTREVEQEPIRVLPPPVTFSERIAAAGERYHYVDIEVDETNLENDSLIFQGSIKFPNSEVQTFHISYQQKRQLEIFQNDYGEFIIEMDVFGNTKDGRELVLDLPVFSFTTQMVDLENMIAEDMSDGQTEMAPMEREVQQDKIKQPKEQISILLIVLINFLLVLVGFLMIWFVVLKKPMPKLSNVMALIKRKKKVTEDSDDQNKEKDQKKGKDSSSSDDILDLSLPDD